MKRLLLAASLLALTMVSLLAVPAAALDCTKPKNATKTECQGYDWSLVFRDDFDRNVPLGAFSDCDPNGCDGLDAHPHTAARWGAYTDGWTDTFGRGTYSPSQVIRINKGRMILTLHTDDGVHRVAAVVPLVDRPRLYGRFEVRLRAVGSFDCYRLASLLWPDSGVFPRDGEIDFPEGWLSGALGGWLHHQGATRQNDQTQLSAGGARWRDWHTTAIEWRPGDARFYVDGRQTARVTTRVPNTPMHWVIQTEVGRDCVVDPADRGEVQIDYVAVWRPG